MSLHPRRVLLALSAILALSLAATAIASAATPEFKPVPSKNKFTVTGGATVMFGGGTIVDYLECKASSATGQVTGARTVGSLVITYTGCKSNNNFGNCATNSVGAKAGEVVTKTLVGELGTVAKTQAASGVGLLLKPAEKTKWFTLEHNPCILEGTVTGSLAAEVKTVGKKLTTNSLVFGTTSGKEHDDITEITMASGVVEKPEFQAEGDLVTVNGTSNSVTFEEALEVT